MTTTEVHSTSTTKLCEYDEAKLKWMFWNAGKSIVGEKFVVREQNKDVITELIKYFTGNNGKYDLNKGIYLFGSFGTGKTVLMLTFRKMLSDNFPFSKYGFHSTSIEQIIDHYKQENDFKFYGFREHDHPLTICINEFGKSIDERIYGTRADEIIKSLLMIRYELFQGRKIVTHVTSNFEPGELEYSPIIMDRIKEMFNFIKIDGQSFRK